MMCVVSACVLWHSQCCLAIVLTISSSIYGGRLAVHAGGTLLPLEEVRPECQSGWRNKGLGVKTVFWDGEAASAFL